MATGRDIAPRGGGMAARPAAGGVAVRNSRTHGGSVDNIAVITAALRFAELKQAEMNAELLHAEVDEELRARIDAWLTQATAVRLFIRNGFDRIDQGLEPLLGAVERAGGTHRVGNKVFHSDQ